MKIKTFDFLVSNYLGNESFILEGEYDFSYGNNIVYTQKMVDSKINDFCKDKKVIDIKVNNYTIHHHNNARCDSVIMRYTIMFEG